MKHWHIEQMKWDSFDPIFVDPDTVLLVKAASVVEGNASDYAVYLKNVFTDDPHFSAVIGDWATEEIQHGQALGRWAMLADPHWDYHSALEDYRRSFQVPLSVDTSVRGSRTGELIARCMVETGTSSYYTALHDATSEPLLKSICKQIAADEFRHFKLFYDHMKRYLERENLGVWERMKIALGRVAESEDDELASAYYTTNIPDGVPYNYKKCIAAYMYRAIPLYQPRHLDRVIAMILKTIGITSQARIHFVITKVAFILLKYKHHKFKRILA